MKRAVIFDLGGVIVPLDFPRAFAELAGVCAHSAEQVPLAIQDTGLVPLLEMGKIEPEEFHRRICIELGMELTFTEFREAWGALFSPETLIPESLLVAVRRRHRLLLLSNTNAIHFPLIEERYPLLRHFHDFILSYEVGVMKPDPGIYRAAVARAGVEPADCVFVDDVEENVAGAICEGLDAFRFESAEQVVRELRRRGIEV